ncbi:hypothetical protein Dsui_0208 [Azospira oryzae PS]|uniref:Uncharacterized protein n=1 Tax=Azospira oryzae (strain ATCC BAA-33 / DSM 13638 / PS) TaxID=640081 RepID=G8QMP8_AZOOP|nr:phage tail protein [Azospira oryzae]AEV24628.1 hypothetical protein Dsui_0208 [Azospira oryzae PS]
MGGIFGGGGKTIHQTTPVISSIRIQTSAYGTPIPIAYGRPRIAPNLIQYTDFTAIPHTSSSGGGGKGGGGGGGGVETTTYTYTAAILMSICEGPIQDVPAAYVGKKRTSLAALGFTLFDGSPGQAPFGYMTSKHPTKALNYPDLAYVGAGAYDLGETATLDNHNFDVICNPAFRIANDGIGRSLVKLVVRQGALRYNRVSAADVQWSIDGTTWTTAETITLPDDNADHSFILAAPPGIKPWWRLRAASGLRGFKGDYSSATQYYAGDVVAYNGGYWLVLSAVKNSAPKPQTVSEVIRTVSDGEYTSAYTETVYSGSWTELPSACCRWSVANLAFFDSTAKEALDFTTADRSSGAFLRGYPPKYAFDGSNDTEWRSSEQGNDVSGAAWIGQYFGPWDVSPATVSDDILTHDRYGAGFPGTKMGDLGDFHNYCVASNLLVSPCYNEQRAAQEIISELAVVGNSGIVFSEGVLKIIPYGDAPVTGNGTTWTPSLTAVYDLTDDDYQPDEGEDPVTCTRSSSADAYNWVQVKFSNRLNQYAVEVAESKDQADIELNGLRPMPVIDLQNVVCDATVAKAIADLSLRRSLYIRNVYEFRLAWNYCRLEPMDIVTLTDANLGLVQTPVRVTAVEEDEDGLLTITAEDLVIGTGSSADQNSPDVDGYSPDFNVMPGDASPPVFVNAPGNLTATGYELWMAVAGASANWGGCQVWVSFDGVSYKQAGTIYGGARLGTLTAPLAAGTDPDTVGVLSVDFNTLAPNATLLSASQEDCDNLVTLCKVDGELLVYRDATLTGTGTYDLTYLRRGAYNTANTLHSPGATFVRLDDAVFKYAYDPEYSGKAVWIKLPSFNIYGAGLQDIDQVQAYQTMLGTAASYPPDVTGFAAAQNGQAVLFQWQLLTQANVAGYEIRFNEQGILSWDDATPVTQVTRGTQITTVKVPPGDWTFLIAAKDTSGNYSQNKTAYDLSVTNANDVIYSRDEAQFWETGTLLNLVIHQPTRKLVPASQGTAYDDGWDTFDKACPQPFGSYYYEPAEINLGIEGAVRSYGVTNSQLVVGGSGVADPEVLIDYKTAAGAYRGLQPWGIGTFTAQYIKQRLTINPQRGLCNVSSFVLAVDAERRTEEYFSFTVDSAGSALNFAKPFFKQPAITGTVVSATAASLAITAQSTAGASFKVFNTSGAAIAGLANIQIKGV